MIKVVVVENSTKERAEIRKILESDGSILIVDEAEDYESALRTVCEKKPDVVLLAVDMPGISGLDILNEIMRRCPTPTIILSKELGAEDSLAAFRYGCVDCLAITDDLEVIAEEMIALVKVAASVEVKSCFPTKPKETIVVPAESDKLIIITASTGGPSAIETVLKAFPAEFPCGVLIVQHLPPTFTRTFAKRLDRMCRITVKEAADGLEITAGHALIAPGGRNVLLAEVDDRLVVKLDDREGPHGIRPSIDMTLESAASTRGDRCIAVILTGMGKDGAAGARAIRQKGGVTIVQDKSTSCVYGIPKAVAEGMNADFVLPLYKISDKIAEVI